MTDKMLKLLLITLFCSLISCEKEVIKNDNKVDPKTDDLKVCKADESLINGACLSAKAICEQAGNVYTDDNECRSPQELECSKNGNVWQNGACITSEDIKKDCDDKSGILEEGICSCKEGDILSQETNKCISMTDHCATIDKIASDGQCISLLNHCINQNMVLEGDSCITKEAQCTSQGKIFTDDGSCLSKENHCLSQDLVLYEDQCITKENSCKNQGKTLSDGLCINLDTNCFNQGLILSDGICISREKHCENQNMVLSGESCISKELHCSNQGLVLEGDSCIPPTLTLHEQYCVSESYTASSCVENPRLYSCHVNGSQ